VQFPDVLPTILDTVGLGNNAYSMHGKSFLPVLNAETDKHRKAVIMGYYEGVDRCVRDNLWSYVQRPEGEPDELYNLNEDPKEMSTSSTSVPKKPRGCHCSSEDTTADYKPKQ
jgi:arylsulfatase A-like enzyme